MSRNDELDDSIKKLVKRYSSLFTLPTIKRILFLLFGVFLLGGALSLYAINSSILNLALGAICGLAFFSLVVVTDYFLSKIVMRGDPIYDFRRISAVSLFSSSIWLLFVILGGILAVIYESPSLWLKLFLLGFCASTILRTVVFSTTSLSSYSRLLFSSLLPPFLCIIPVLSAWHFVNREFYPSVFWFVPSAILIILLGVFLFIFSVELVAKKSALKISALRIFKAFLTNWSENLNAPLEAFFNELGEERDVQVSMIGFRKLDGQMKALMIIPSFHPGPFRNLGSSLIPSMIQKAVEEKLRCPVAVPHGLFGHELDLASQEQSRKVVKAVVESLSFTRFLSKASPFVRVQEEPASASCQLFGDCALITLTLAPKTTEDLPYELGEAILAKAKNLELSNAVVINAHNSIEGQFNLDEALPHLKNAAFEGLARAMIAKPKPLQVGVASLKPKEYGIREGMGPGGIVALVTRVGDQKAAYVTVDGNNMVSGLREEILEALKGTGVEAGEILTTDTHAVCGIVLDPRGYHPVGEVMNRARFIGYIKKVVSEALKNLESVEVAWRVLTVRNVKVVGARQIDALCFLADQAIKRAKRAALSIFPALGAILIAMLTFL